MSETRTTAGEPVDAADLAAHPAFAGLASAELEGVARGAVRRQLADGSELFRLGEPAGRLFLVERGQIALRVADHGRSTIVMSAGPGDVLGWSALRPGAHWMTTGRAVGPATVVQLEASAVFDLVTSGSPGARALAARLFEVAAAHLHQTQAQLLRTGREGTITGG